MFLAAGLSVLVLIGWNALFPPPRPLPPAVEPTAIETAAQPAEVAAAVVDAVVDPAQDPGNPSPAAAAAIRAHEIREIAVDNGVFQVTLSNRGGIATSWMLRDATTGNEPLELLPPIPAEAAATLGIQLDDARLAETLNRELFEVSRVDTTGGERIEFVWADGLGLEARKTLTFDDGSYMVQVDLEVSDRGRPLPASLIVGPGFGEQGASTKTTYYYEAVQWNRAGEVTHRQKRKLSEEIESVTGSVRWAGLEDQYFAALVVPTVASPRASWHAVKFDLADPDGAPGETREESYPRLAVQLPEGGARLYVGPKDFQQLEALGSGLEDAVWFSSYSLLSWISRQILFALLWIHGHIVPNWGLAIILCTFSLRVLLFPVNQYAMVSMKKTQIQMQALSPKIKSIKNKYAKKKDAESRGKMNQEMMDLYKREGVNPMGGINGCLPMFAQFPILISFYFMLTVAVELRGAPFFGWIHDLSVADPFYVTPLLMGASMFWQQKLAMSKVTDPTQQQQQKIMMVMPFVFTWICFQMPAGMVLYWFVNNLLGIGQQALVNRHTTRLEAAEQKA